MHIVECVGADFYKWPWGRDSSFPPSPSPPFSSVPPPFPSPPFPPFPVPSLSYPLPSCLFSFLFHCPCPHPLNPARSGERCNISLRVWAEPGRQMHFAAFSGWNLHNFCHWQNDTFISLLNILLFKKLRQNSCGGDLMASPPQLFGRGGDCPHRVSAYGWMRLVSLVCKKGGLRCLGNRHVEWKGDTDSVKSCTTMKDLHGTRLGWCLRPTGEIVSRSLWKDLACPKKIHCFQINQTENRVLGRSEASDLLLGQLSLPSLRGR